MIRILAVVLVVLAFAAAAVGAAHESRRQGHRSSCIDADNMTVVAC